MLKYLEYKALGIDYCISSAIRCPSIRNSNPRASIIAILQQSDVRASGTARPRASIIAILQQSDVRASGTARPWASIMKKIPAFRCPGIRNSKTLGIDYEKDPCIPMLQRKYASITISISSVPNGLSDVSSVMIRLSPRTIPFFIIDFSLNTACLA